MVRFSPFLQYCLNICLVAQIILIFSVNRECFSYFSFLTCIRRALNLELSYLKRAVNGLSHFNRWF